jgi:predicted methyltransferase
LAEIASDVAAAVGLAEGPAGVRAVLTALARLEPVSIRRLSRAVELPVPIVASICGELRKRSVVSEQRPAQLTQAGRKLYGACRLVVDPAGLARARREIASAAALAPPPAVELDQCHCTVETKVRRVLALNDADALVGRRVLFLGDDDLGSLALSAVVGRLGSASTVAGIAVLDVDPRLLAFVRGRLEGAPFPVRCMLHDVREPPGPDLREAFDTIVTDPPYTDAAARLFLSRAAQALDGGGDVFLSFGSRRPGAAFRLQRAIGDMGFVIRRLERDFNEYVGAGALGGTSHLYHLTATPELRPLVAGRYGGPLYTAEVGTDRAVAGSRIRRPSRPNPPPGGSS